MKTKIFKEIDGEFCLATSYSQIDSFLQCPYRWKRDYLLGEREFHEAEALNLGSSVHSTLETILNGIKDGYEWTVGEVQDTLEMEMEEANIPWISEENKEIAVVQHLQTIGDFASKTSNLYKFIQDKEIVACEKEFRLPFKLTTPVLYNNTEYSTIYFVGAIDCILKDLNGNYIAVDFKTSKKTYQPKKLRENLQLPIYSLVIQQLYGELPIATKYYFTRLDEFQDVEPLVPDESMAEIVYYKSGKKKGEIKHKQRCVDDIYNTLNDIFYQQYSAGAYKAKPSPLCSWCSHGGYEKGDCEYDSHFMRKDIPLPEREGMKYAKRKTYRKKRH